VQPGPGVRVPNLDRLALNFRRGFFQQRDDTPPALLYLTIRAARRALADNPDDARTLLGLGEAYRRLLRDTRERVWGMRLPQLTELRRAQASWALNQAAALRPDVPEVHLHLGNLYQEMDYLDLALHHLRTHQKLLLKAGPPPGIDAGQFRAQVDRHEQELSRLAAEVEDRESVYEAESAKLRLQDRAKKALEKGLAGKALEMLREFDLAAFGQEGLRLELELLLRTGRAREVRDWTNPEHEEQLGADYYWLRAQALAAVGDYALAGDELARLATLGRGTEHEGPRGVLAKVIGQAVLDQQPGAESVPRLAWQARRQADLGGRVGALATTMRLEADWTVLRGLLAVEQGEVAGAAAAFRTALAYWKDEPTTAAGGGVDFAGRPLAQNVLRWVERDK